MMEMARFSQLAAGYSPKLLGSKVGRLPMAKIAPVWGSMISTAAPAEWVRFMASSRASSMTNCILLSMVR